MFWELSKVRDALNELCKKWSFNDCKAYSKNTINISEESPTPNAAGLTSASPLIAIVGSQKEKNNSSN